MVCNFNLLIAKSKIKMHDNQYYIYLLIEYTCNYLNIATCKSLQYNFKFTNLM